VTVCRVLKGRCQQRNPDDLVPSFQLARITHKELQVAEFEFGYLWRVLTGGRDCKTRKLALSVRIRSNLLRFDGFAGLDQFEKRLFVQNSL